MPIIFFFLQVLINKVAQQEEKIAHLQNMNDRLFQRIDGISFLPLVNEK